MKQIKLKTIMAGPRGNHGAGCILTVGEHIDAETARELVKTNQAEEVKAVDEKPKKADKAEEKADEKVHMPEAPKEDTPSRKSKGKNPRGR